MNPLNCATLKACQRLVEAGIVLETENVWIIRKWRRSPILCLREEIGLETAANEVKQILPAPSMAEVWRELPGGATIQKRLGTNVCWTDINPSNCQPFADVNPTDALIALRNWLEERKEKV